MSNSMAQVVIIGNLTRDSELKYTNDGLAICKFSVAVNVREKVDGKWAEVGNFYNVTIFGKDGERVNQYLTKGKSVALSGELSQRKWSKDGVDHVSVEIKANGVTLLGGKPDERTDVQRQEPRRPIDSGDAPF